MIYSYYLDERHRRLVKAGIRGNLLKLFNKYQIQLTQDDLDNINNSINHLKTEIEDHFKNMVQAGKTIGFNSSIKSTHTQYKHYLKVRQALKDRL